MYASNYNSESGIPVPDGYSGTMLPREEETVETVKDVGQSKPDEACESAGHFSGIFGGVLGNITGGSFLRDFKLGSEEILIIGAAVFLLLSGSADIECLIILIVLLFIK